MTDDPVPRECGYNHPVGTRCPACADWPYKKGGAAAYLSAQGSTVMTPEPAQPAAIDWSKPLEAVHLLGLRRTVKVAQMNAGVNAGNDHWIVTAGGEKLDNSPGALASFWASDSGVVPAYAGWRIRNVRPAQPAESLNARKEPRYAITWSRPDDPEKLYCPNLTDRVALARIMSAADQNGGVLVHSIEPSRVVQPAKSPEARAFLAGFDAATKLLDDSIALGDPNWLDYRRQARDTFAATTARPTERGAVEAHFARMQDMMRRYVEPCTYVASFPKDSSKWESEFPEPQPDQSSVARLNCKARRDAAFIADMIHMMDGPEQRALTPPVTVAATDQAGEVGRGVSEYAFDELWHAIDAATAVHNGVIAISVVEFRKYLAALDTQPATGGTMGGEEKLRATVEAAARWLDEISTNCDMAEIVADGGTTAGMVVQQEAREQMRRLRTALQNGGE